jgi:hypothetical protein
VSLQADPDAGAEVAMRVARILRADPPCEERLRAQRQELAAARLLIARQQRELAALRAGIEAVVERINRHRTRSRRSR